MSLALFCGLVVPTAIGYLWDDVLGAYIWGGLVSRLVSEWRDLLSTFSKFDC